MSTPTIANIPTAYKAGKIYSQLPVDGSADFDVTRNSTATRVNQDGLIEEVGVDVPRLDYTDGGCPVWLIEPQSTNLITYSEDFSNVFWNLKTNINLTGSQTSPRGDSTAYLIDSTANNAFLQGAISGVASTDYAHSLYVKANNVTGKIYLKQANGTLDEILVTNEWQRFETISQGSTATIRFGVTFQNSGDSLYIWGAQLEERSSATSYIPNNGYAAGVTRDAETVTLDTTVLNLTTITETFSDDSTNVVSPVPSSYVVSEGKIKKIEGE